MWDWVIYVSYTITIREIKGNIYGLYKLQIEVFKAF